MELTDNQLKSIESGHAVPVVIDHRECVVILKDVYEKVLNLRDDDLTESEITACAMHAFDDADTGGPIE